MAHYAKLIDNIVDQVVVVNSISVDEDDEQSVNYYLNEIGMPGIWKKCSYNTVKGVHKQGGVPFRGNYPGPGMVYDEELDMFINNKKTSDKDIFDEKTYMWISPEEVQIEQQNDIIATDQ